MQKKQISDRFEAFSGVAYQEMKTRFSSQLYPGRFQSQWGTAERFDANLPKCLGEQAAIVAPYESVRTSVLPELCTASAREREARKALYSERHRSKAVWLMAEGLLSYGTGCSYARQRAKARGRGNRDTALKWQDIMALPLRTNWSTNNRNFRKERSMSRSRFTVARFLLFLVVCITACAVFASELPEQITLTNDTSNDYVLCRPGVLKQTRVLSMIRSITPQRNTHLTGQSLFHVYAGEVKTIAARNFSIETILRT